MGFFHGAGMNSNELDRARWLLCEADRQVHRQHEIVASLTQQGLPVTEAVHKVAELKNALERCRYQLRIFEEDRGLTRWRAPYSGEAAPSAAMASHHLHSTDPTKPFFG